MSAWNSRLTFSSCSRRSAPATSSPPARGYYLRWFLALHYKFNRKLDTPFWKACRQDVDVSGIAPAIEHFQRPGTLSKDGARFQSGDPAFGYEGMMILLRGQKVDAPSEPPRITGKAWEKRLAAQRELVQRALPHAEALGLASRAARSAPRVRHVPPIVVQGPSRDSVRVPSRQPGRCSSATRGARHDGGSRAPLRAGSLIGRGSPRISARMRAVAASRTPAATFFGRSEELQLASELVRAGARLITIHGAPGVGKSRLLREIEGRWQGEGRRVHHVALGSAVARDDVLAGIARGIGYEPRTRDSRRLIDRLRARLDDGAAVLLLDEVERAANAVAEVACDLVDATEELTIVLASRERLGASSEVLLSLRGLDERSALELLRDRLQRLSLAHFDEAMALRLVRALDGLPLAIELAAARARVIGLAELVRAVARDPGEGFGRADLHRLVQSSWDALSGPAREGLALASVFRGAFDAEAAAAVLAPSLPSPATDVLQELADASLLEIGEGTGGARFLVLGVVRAFAAERLDESDRASGARARHADHYARLAGIDDAALWARVARSREDLLAAWRTLTMIDPARSARLALALDPLLVTQGPPSLHREVLERALGIVRAEEDPRLRAELLRARGRTSGLRGRHGEALRDFREAMALATMAGDEALVGWLAAFLCFSLRAVGDVDESRAHGLAALSVARRRGDPRLEAMSEQVLGLVLLAVGDARGCVAHQRRAAASAATGDAPRLEGIAEANLAAALSVLGEHEAAGRALARSRACFTAIGDRYHLASIGANEAQVMRARGEHEAAERHLTAALAVLQELDDLGGELEARAELAMIADARGDRELARRRLDEAQALARRSDDRSRAAELDALERRLAVGRVEQGPLLVAASARHFTIDGRLVDLSRRGALRRVLAALVRARNERPGEALDVHAVLHAGWPGERMHPDSGAARVYMAIRRLRSLGLESALRTRDDGYLLDPALPVRVDDRDC